MFRVTHVATGVSGITNFSPSLSVARQTGRMLFSTFYNQGNEIHRLEANETMGTPVTPSAVAEGAQLPPPDVTQSLVMGYLADKTTGLPPATDFTVQPYHSSFSLDQIGQPSVGVVAGGPFGSGVAGGVSMVFGDQLSDRQIFAAIQANGTVKDIGGALQYYNLKRRWNWGAGIEHIPYLTGTVFLQAEPGAGRGRLQREPGPATHLHRSGDDVHAVSVLEYSPVGTHREHHALRVRHGDLQDRIRRRG